MKRFEFGNFLWFLGGARYFSPFTLSLLKKHRENRWKLFLLWIHAL